MIMAKENFLKMLKPTVSAMGDVVKVKIFLLAIRAIRSWQMERGIKSRYFSENFSLGIRDSCPRKQMDDWMWGRFWLRLEIKILGFANAANVISYFYSQNYYIK